ncbi:hypothetical protein [Bifidobacterium callitrichidarum]|uniref:Uncharacterized protein n=1 Tax=Bifidobacterium callitrichidarum TaxID=2052941 RepID=A0A2U2N0E0_9BIFI|nr:hypothetical protein [Bifidobacterium callitrichidarum]PWG62656.1 hypothetical protein DF196_11905 [Bifidobacterium callitrichidarum]
MSEQGDYVQAVSAYYRYLNLMREQLDLEAIGKGATGETIGDGVPRDLSGHPYEPLSWPNIAC